MNRNYKHQQLLNILSDIKMFLKVIKRVEMNKNYNGFAIIKKNNLIDSKTYKNIYPRGSILAHLYGCRKVHKIKDQDKSQSLRLFIHYIDSFSNHLATYLSNLLQPWIHIKNSVFEFL